MDPNQQHGHLDVEGKSSLLGLKLKKSQSFLKLLENKLNSTKVAEPKKRKRSDANMSAKDSHEKAKASNFSVSILRIGSWEKVSRREGDLVAKCYYAKQKLVWEVLESGLKNKIEVQWSDIASFKATFNDDLPDTLEVELLRPPLFFRETNPQPRKHTIWQATVDFTGGQASNFRRQFLQFPHATLWKHYNKLLQLDYGLSLLSKKPYPSLHCPFFVPESVQTQNSSAFEICGWDWQSSNRQTHLVNERASDEYTQPLLCFLVSKEAATSNCSKWDQTCASVDFSSGTDGAGVVQRTTISSLNTFPVEFPSMPTSGTASINHCHQPSERRIEGVGFESFGYNAITVTRYDPRSYCSIPKVEGNPGVAGLNENQMMRSEKITHVSPGISYEAQTGGELCTSNPGIFNAEYPASTSDVDPLFVLIPEGARASNGVEWDVWP